MESSTRETRYHRRKRLTSFDSDSDDSDYDVSDSDVSGLMYLLDEPALKISGKRLMKGLDIPHVKIPEGIEDIRQFAFLEFSKLISVHFPNSLINIQSDAFYKCSSLKSVDLSSTRLSRIGKRAFSMCTSIQSIQLPKTLNTIDVAAFYGCTSLTNVVFSVGLDNIGTFAFYECTSLTSVDLSQTSLSRIENATFDRCTQLTSVKLPTSLTSIGDSAFSNCTHLTSVELPDSLTSIESGAFSMCTGLTSVDLSQTSLTSIGYGAFYRCTSLSSVVFPSAPALQINGDTFSLCTMLSVLVPPCQVDPFAFVNCRLVLNASGNTIHNSIVIDPRIIELRQRLMALWSQNVRRQGRMRQSGKHYKLLLSKGMMDYELQQSNRERPEVLEIWTEIKQLLVGVPRRDEVVEFLFPKIIEGGKRLVRMKSYLNQPKETKVFKKVLDDLGITEPRRYRNWKGRLESQFKAQLRF